MIKCITCWTMMLLTLIPKSFAYIAALSRTALMDLTMFFKTLADTKRAPNNMMVWCMYAECENFCIKSFYIS